MNIFLSWSGEQSKKVAETLKIWLPSVIQSLKPFYSSTDIQKGKRWDNELSKTLNETEFGIIILVYQQVPIIGVVVYGPMLAIKMYYLVVWNLK